ncbi:hypothetical protein A3J20_05455 [Candidatus Gottesmanbacteria bacterium RIFCSPLOWO2_02_FULL_42_29]|uniref:Phosphoglycerate mutase n=2 Tax=Candidatus Gottesmaniibacteriota TaxID=1752720 RepID=A0A1F6BGG6_9BACT|nr:MAG: hypothetical protein A2781_04115 [Candidatus Gottesmanbacteria bacterium RIFCSPHIGHO2_01_FULL_42_27]OGG20881.1 MAG: hypothetical protein A3E72_06690 [Candidatus Gottesmanbacteria bacterium RIFCSPHIGHO2_12_FULL_43_26]OGG35438.1 MAG: hypothetical protein A3G68_03250 [Candidatus Gottesmanbacteria bacterium RIFCSPLOWO2_12_FULL_42_10]OGG35968.1 MAG: hypothetical protein A2968_03615 [Candidatus Gottesmanbacteria bacterium RIFCSPLOWO2_01_FULL_42_22]OGG38182.1 MAG: hypothetical protein A3J20_05
MKPTTFIFIRHGEVHNPKKILYGRQGRFALSHKGKQEAEAAGRKLVSRAISQIIASPMLRTRQTSKIIGNIIGVKPRYSRLLIEVRTIFEKISLTEYHGKIQVNLYSEEFVKKGQESVREIAERMIKFVKLKARQYPGKTVLVVSHGDPILILKAVSINREFSWNYKRNNYLKTAEFMVVKYSQGIYEWEGNENR